MTSRGSSAKPVAPDDFPRLLHPTVDAVDVRGLALFYGELLGLHPLEDDAGSDQPNWLSLADDDGIVRLAVQRVDELTPTTWPDPRVPMQLHLEFLVDSTPALERHVRRALAAGARLLLDRSTEPDEQVFVLADPAGHPFCLLARDVPANGRQA